jgi:hypothetical protein
MMIVAGVVLAIFMGRGQALPIRLFDGASPFSRIV